MRKKPKPLVTLYVGASIVEEWEVYPNGTVARTFAPDADDDGELDPVEGVYDVETDMYRVKPKARWKIVGAVQIRRGRIVQRWTLGDIAARRVPWGRDVCVLNRYRGEERPMQCVVAYEKPTETETSWRR